LFFDEAYHHEKPGQVAFAGWAVEQDRLNRSLVRLQGLSRTRPRQLAPSLRLFSCLMSEIETFRKPIRAAN